MLLGNSCSFNNVLMFSDYSSDPSMGPLKLHLKIQKTDLTETLVEFYQCGLNEMRFSFYRGCSITLMCFFLKIQKGLTCWLNKIEEELGFGKHLLFLEEHVKFVK